MTLSKQEEREKRFDEKFKCIQPGCDGNGNIPVLVSGSRQISDTEFEQTQEWEAEQCQFHAEYIFPFKAFIQSEIDLALAERNREVMEKRDAIWNILCGMDTNIKSEKEYADEIINLITNK